jgi:hypothetical protein
MDPELDVYHLSGGSMASPLSVSERTLGEGHPLSEDDARILKLYKKKIIVQRKEIENLKKEIEGLTKQVEDIKQKTSLNNK